MYRCLVGATIAKANMWRYAFSVLKFAKFLCLAPFVIGYVPASSLDDSATDIIMVYTVVLIGTYIFSWSLSGIWLDYLKKASDK
ncbi:MAG: hypothetical protein GY814_15010 [Gammaproteobacteria bacterium]|nr:hypothetical protein [Gammaproteobacteria bacterium]